MTQALATLALASPDCIDLDIAPAVIRVICAPSAPSPAPPSSWLLRFDRTVSTQVAICGARALLYVEVEAGSHPCGRTIPSCLGENAHRGRSIPRFVSVSSAVTSSTTRLPGGNPGANLKSISHRCHPILVACVWELTNATIELPLGCLQGG